jgi:hypothetical protein
MTAEAIVQRLEGARETSPHQWVARCPAHKDRSPSLSVRDVGDGRTLVHCFAGCEPEAVVGALGLRMADLMPPKRITATSHKPAPRINAEDALALLMHELTVAVLLTDGMAANAMDGNAPNTLAAQRLAECAARIAKVRGLADDRAGKIARSPELARLRAGDFANG